MAGAIDQELYADSDSVYKNVRGKPCYVDCRYNSRLMHHGGNCCIGDMWKITHHRIESEEKHYTTIT